MNVQFPSIPYMTPFSVCGFSRRNEENDGISGAAPLTDGYSA